MHHCYAGIVTRISSIPAAQATCVVLSDHEGIASEALPILAFILMGYHDIARAGTAQARHARHEEVDILNIGRLCDDLAQLLAWSRTMLGRRREGGRSREGGGVRNGLGYINMFVIFNAARGLTFTWHAA